MSSRKIGVVFHLGKYFLVCGTASAEITVTVSLSGLVLVSCEIGSMISAIGETTEIALRNLRLSVLAAHAWVAANDGPLFGIQPGAPAPTTEPAPPAKFDGSGARVIPIKRKNT